MANHLRRQIREAAAAALTGLATSGNNVFQSRTHELQDAQLPGLRIYTNDEAIQLAELGLSRIYSLERDLDLVVEACAKESADLDDKLDLMIKEIETAIAANQGIGGAKWVQLKSINVEMEGEAEKQVGVARMTFQVRYNAALGAPDVPL